MNLELFFSHKHLPPHLGAASRPCCDLAMKMDDVLDSCAEKSAGMRKLLEAKDCFVRAALEQHTAKASES